MTFTLDHFNTTEQLEQKGFEFIGEKQTENPINGVRKYQIFAKDDREYALRILGQYTDGVHVELKPTTRMNLNPIMC